MARWADWAAGPIKPNRSSWVDQYGVAILKDGRVGIAIKFLKSGFVAFYPDSSEADFIDMKNAKSKGKFIWRRLIEQDYEEMT